MSDDVTRSIDIRSDIWTVFEAVSQPGWYISDEEGDTTGQTLEDIAGGTLLIDPRYGKFFFRPIAEDAPNSTSHQCVFYPLDDPNPDFTRTDSTTCEFTLESGVDGTTLTITERDYHKLGMSDEDTEAFMADNAAGWETKLAHIKAELESNPS